jgi:RimJ/RimL family protein N-acetyltransferase
MLSVEKPGGNMARSTNRWHVSQDATNEEAEAILVRDPVWNCFALADLEPPLRNYSQFHVARQEEGDEHAICLILRHPIIGQVISPYGNDEGIAAILNQVALPERVLIQAQERHFPLLQHHYQPETNWRSLLRMAIPSPSHLSLAQIHTPPHPIKQMDMADVPALEVLYARYGENPFSAELFARAVFFGAYEGEQIVAAGGTHVLSRKYGIAVIGNILTAPQARRQGYATAITAALAAKLFEWHFSTIVLNVFEDNRPAVRIYQRLGFQTRHRLWTGQGILS